MNPPAGGKIDVLRNKCSAFRIRNADDEPQWLVISGFSALRIEESELGTDSVFAGVESEPFSLLNTEH